MASSRETTKGKTKERLIRFGRDINALGALAIAGVAAIIPGPNAILASWASLNAAQAGGLELWRQNLASKNRHSSKRVRKQTKLARLSLQS